MYPIDTVFKPILTADARPDILKDYPVVHVQPVAWGEMDAFNHLNNVAYYRYAESARISYLRETGLMMFGRDDLLTILASSSCQYLKPVTFPDTLLLGIRIKKLGNTSVIFECAFISSAQNAIVAQSEAVIVRTDTQMQKQGWSDKEREILSRFENRPL